MSVNNIFEFGYSAIASTFYDPSVRGGLISFLPLICIGATAMLGVCRYRLATRSIMQISPKGLPNLGSTCFANSVLQFLFSTPGIDDILRGEDGATTASADQMTFRRNLIALKEEHSKLKPSAERMRALLTTLWASPTLNRLQMTQNQEDAHEFLILLSDILNIGNHFTLNSASIRTNPDTGRALSARSVREDVLLPISNQSATLQGCVDEYLKPEILTDLGQHATNYPDYRQKRLFFTGPVPEVIQFGLKRFEFTNAGDCTKIGTPIQEFDRPFQVPFCNDQGDITSRSAYQVDAVICHQGSSPQNGHYFTLVKTLSGWLEYNDSCERKLSDAQGLAIIASDGYLAKARRIVG